MAEARTMIREAVELLLESYAENVAVITPRDEPNASRTSKF